MNIFYRNHLGEQVNLDSENIILQYQELFDYSWDAEMRNGKITRFYRDSITVPVTVAVTADTQEEYEEILATFYRITEVDVVDGSPGKLYLGEQYLKCYICASIKEDAFLGIEHQKKNLTIVSDHPYWVREHHYRFRKNETEPESSKRYANRYPYRYANGLTNSRIVNDHYADSNFLLTIYGPIVDPVLYIGGHEYSVKIVLEEGEYLEIDSTAGTVVKVKVSGERVNAFHYRSFENSVFEPIHPGGQDVGWSGRFAFDLVIYEERSEPRWR